MSPVSVRFSAKEQITFIVLSRASSEFRHPTPEHQFQDHPGTNEGEREVLQIVDILKIQERQLCFGHLFGEVGAVFYDEQRPLKPSKIVLKFHDCGQHSTTSM